MHYLVDSWFSCVNDATALTMASFVYSMCQAAVALDDHTMPSKQKQSGDSFLYD